MPLYEFRCTSCDERAERLLTYAQLESPAPCEACGEDVQRLWSRVGVQLNGWGFAGNDSMVADRPGRGDFKSVRESAERLSEG